MNKVESKMRSKSAFVLSLVIFAICPAWSQDQIPMAEFKQIRGGQVAPGDKYLFSVYIQIDGFCSGTLIAPTWVLSAAHCYSDGSSVTLPKEIFKVEIGEDDDQTNEIIQGGVKQVLVHPDFSSNGGYSPFVNDVALIELERPFNLSPEPIRFLSKDEESQYAASGTVATLLGHGRNWRVHEVELPLYLGTDCHAVFDPSQSRFGAEQARRTMHDGTVCTGIIGDTDKGSEGGDSGGSVLVPLSRSINGKITWGLVGVISHSMTNNARERYAVISTRVSSVYDWVQNIIQSRAILTHTVAGPLGSSVYKTEVALTNLGSSTCAVDLLFNQGIQDAPPIRFNGEYHSGNLFSVGLEEGSAQKVVLASDGETLVVGAVYITQSLECTNLQVSGRYLVTVDGQIMEVLSVPPQSRDDWLKDRDCVVLTGDFDGERSNISLAMVTSVPGQQAPVGSQLIFNAFDWEGQPVGDLESLEVTGVQNALNPWNFDESRLILMCLDVPQDNGFRLSLIAITTTATSRNVQYSINDLVPVAR